MNSTKDSKENRALLLVGPTAVGKTELSLELAKRLTGEVVSADSRQVYRGLDIGTAKPTVDERARVKHHFIDIRDPDQEYSAGEYGREARHCIAGLLECGKTPLVVGGSGFYLRALVDGLFAPRVSDAAIKEKWRCFYREQGEQAAHQGLAEVDPETAARLHPNDMQRVVRALEVYEITGVPISRFRSGTETPAEFQAVWIGLWRDRESLYRRIEMRVDWMIDEGLVGEVERLQKKGYGLELNALRTVGYQEVFSHLSGVCDDRQMVAEIKKNSRRYAKRQITWFKRDSRIRWLDLDCLTSSEAIDAVVKIWHTAF